MEKFERLERLIGLSSLEKLKNSSVAIIGCGGVGGYVIEALVRSNIGKLIIIDYDVVTKSNCNRQIIATDTTIGQKKVVCFGNRIHDINPTCQTIIYDQKLNSDNIHQMIPLDINYVVDACDDTNAKLALIQYCTIHKIPMISSMGTGNRLDPSQLCITTLDKTTNDPLAKVMRHKVRKANIKIKIPVCTSTELPIKTNDNVIASCSFVPASAGLLIASYVIKELIKKENENC